MVEGRSTEGLPFPRELIQYACQGDTKRRGPQTRSLCWTWLTRAAKPCVRQSRHPAISLSGLSHSEPLHSGSLRDTNLGLSKFPIFYLRTMSLATACLLPEQRYRKSCTENVIRDDQRRHLFSFVQHCPQMNALKCGYEMFSSPKLSQPAYWTRSRVSR